MHLEEHKEISKPKQHTNIHLEGKSAVVNRYIILTWGRGKLSTRNNIALKKWKQFT